MITSMPSIQAHGRRSQSTRAIGAALLAIAVLLIVSSHLIPATSPTLRSVPTSAQSRLPLAFVPNQGQSDPKVRYQADGMGGTLFFTDDQVVLTLPAPQSTQIVRIQFAGATGPTALNPGARQAGIVNWINGNDPAHWQLNLPTYAGLVYQQLYPGIDLHYDGTAGALKSTYQIAPGSNPNQIALQYQGITGMSVDPRTGDLHMTLPGTTTPLIERAPIAWQEANGQRTPVVVHYSIHTDGTVGFALGAYDQARPLIIDPTLEYSTYLGGSGTDRINAVAIDSVSGDVFVTGETSSTPFPGSPTLIGSTGVGTYPNVFVARVAANGSGTVYRTVIGGTNADQGLALAISSGSVANIVGTTFSNDFPLPGSPTPYQSSYSGSGDIIALALNSDGTLAYSSYLGGTSTDAAYGVAVSGTKLYIAGSTDGTFPSTSAPTGGTDAIVVSIDKTAGTTVNYATRIGGLSNDTARAIAIDTTDNIYITGATLSNAGSPPGFPTTTPFQSASGGGSDAFITKLNSSGAVTSSSYFGGSDTDEGLGITVDPSGDIVYLTGRTLSASFPGTTGAPVGQDAFVTKINIGTNTIAYSRYLGSPGVDTGNAIAIDAANAAYVVGFTSSTNFYTQNPLPEMAGKGGNVDGFVTRFDPSGLPSYSTRIGGTANDVATGVATLQTAQGAKVYVVGYTNASDFPMTNPATPIQSTNGGSDDGFLIRISNTRPLVDLTDSTSGNGIDFGPVTWTEAGGAVVGSGAVAPVSVTGLTVSDPDNPGLAYAEVRFVASTASGTTAIVPPDAAAEALNVTLSGGITGSYNTGTGILRLTSGVSSTLADFQAVLRSITYNNSSNVPTSGTRTLAVEVNDGIDSNVPLAFTTISVVATNDPPVVTVPGTGVTLNEEASANITGVSVADVDAGTSNIQVTLSVPAAAGTLSATAGSTTLSGNATASLTISGQVGAINTALGTLQFTGATDFNTSNGTTNTPINLTVLADDLGNSPTPALTDSKTLAITVNPINDAPVVPGPGSFTTLEDTAKTINIVSDLGLSDSKDTAAPAASGAAIFPPVTSLTITTSPTKGAISSINTTAGTFIYTPNADANSSDSFVLQVCDLGTPSSACSNQTVNVTITAVNDVPSFTKGSDVTVLEDSGGYSQAWATAISVGPANESSQTPSFVVTNTNNPLFSAQPAVGASGTLTFTPAANAFGSATVTVQIKDDGGTANGGVDTSATQTFTITITAVNDPPTFTAGADITVNEDSGAYSQAWATSITSGPNETGQTVSFTIVTNSNAALFSAAPLIRNDGTLTFTPAPNTTGSATITFHASDTGGTANSGADTTSPDQTFIISVAAVNDPPAVGMSGGPVAYTENNAAIVVESAATVNDIDSANFNGGSLTASITSGSDTGDTLTIVAGGNVSLAGSNVQYSAATIGTLSGGSAGTPLVISFTSASVTPGVAAELIDQIRYNSTSDAFAPGTTTPKTLTVSINDGGAAPNTGSATRTTNITGLNDAPVLDNTGSMSLTAIPENSSTNSGTLVSTIIASAGGSRISDPDTGALQGIAVIASDTANGIWQFSTDGGTNWTSFGSLSATSSTLLAADARVRFVPNQYFNGTIDPGITFVAWDQTSGTNGQTGVDSTPGGGSTAFSPSATTETAALTILAVNQAPVLDNTGTMTLSPITEDIAPSANTGTLVSAIIASAGGTRITDIDTGAVQGIAIIAADTSNGSWQFSTNGGTTWNTIRSLSNTSATLLASDAQTRVRFQPAANYNGSVDPGITFRAWDQSTGSNGATGIDVSTNGDPSAFSLATETAAITVTPVNDNPTAVNDQLNVGKNSTNNPLNVLANDSGTPDVGETVTITAIGTAQHGTVSIAPGGTGLIYTPAADYSGPDSVDYTISDGNGGSATATAAIQVGQYYVSIPLVLGEPLQPDLEITNFTVTPAGPTFRSTDQVQISVTVKNNGTLPTGGFFVDLYLNPSVVPTKAGILWENTCSLNPCTGISWYVQSGLLGGQSITLTSTPGSYYTNTRWNNVLPVGTKDMYVYVDSWNGLDPDGFVHESNETNNRAEIHGIQVNGPGSPSTNTPLRLAERPLPAFLDRRRNQAVR